jgi:hypothetical protein
MGFTLGANSGERISPWSKYFPIPFACQLNLPPWFLLLESVLLDANFRKMGFIEATPSTSYHYDLYATLPTAIILALALMYISATCYIAWFGPLARLPGPELPRYSSLWPIRNVASANAHLNFQGIVPSSELDLTTCHSRIQLKYRFLLICSKYRKSTSYLCIDLAPLYNEKLLYSIFSVPNLAAHRALKKWSGTKLLCVLITSPWAPCGYREVET